MKRSRGLPRNHNFSFADHASTFNTHIHRSIPGYEQLIEKYVGVSPRFIQERTLVVDYGCSTGAFLSALHGGNEGLHSEVSYIGIDLESAFERYWAELRSANLRFEVGDLRLARFANVSLATSLFTIQFLPAHQKPEVLRTICQALVEGGALMIAEKVLASTARLQDALTFPYYDLKLERGFSASDILDKERQLRGQMTSWTFAELTEALLFAGFREVETVWECFPFVGIIALK